MTETKQIQSGSNVTLHLKIMLKDKTVAEDTRQYDKPVNILMGEGHFSENFEKHLLGLKVGEKNTFLLPPEDAFGEHDEKHLHLVPRDRFPKDEALEPGIVFMFNQPDGAQLPGVVQEVLEDQVRIDFNHPLSGQEVIFEVEIVDVDSPVKH